MKYIDLFGGIGGFSLAIKKNKPTWECVGYYEWDKYAVETYNKNFRTTHKTVDITKLRTEDIPDFDLLCAGFPCQAFSIAGKRRGFQDTRGTMFFEIARIVKVKRPKYLLLENVKGLLNHDKGKTFSTILQTLEELGYETQWMVLNSKFFGVPQNRERVFIIGNLRETSRPEILPFREDAEEVQGVSETARCLDANMWKGVDPKGYFDKGRRNMIFTAHPRSGDPKNIISGTVTQAFGRRGCSKEELEVYNKNNMVLNLYTQERKDFREHKTEGSPTLKSRMGTGGNNVPMIFRAPLKYLNRNQKNIKGNYSFTVDGANTGGVFDGKLRRLTPTECERLQGFPDNWTEGVSNTQRYKQLGNAITVNVVKSIIDKI